MLVIARYFNVSVLHVLSSLKEIKMFYHSIIYCVKSRFVSKEIIRHSLLSELKNCVVYFHCCQRTISHVYRLVVSVLYLCAFLFVVCNKMF
jgi:hypothetical protein